MLCLFLKPLNPNLTSTSLGLSRKLFIRRTMSTESTQHQRMFQLRLDPLTGNSEWVVIEEHQEEQSSSSSSKQPLLAATSYLDMLNDIPRNTAYRQAIDNTITKPCHVLDIGAGTGLLSMMAARAMRVADEKASSSSKVTACESYLPMVKLMRKVLRANGMEKGIRLINKRSDELVFGVDITSRAEVLVSEILDSEFLGEGLIPTMQHAHDKLLVENPQTVPYQATVFGQLIECPYLRRLHDLFNQESEASDGIQLVPKGIPTALSVKRQQYPMHCDAITQEMKLLSEPFKIFDFEFWKRPESCREIDLCIKAIHHGTVHAVISWWLLQLDREGTIFYSTAPKWISHPPDKKELGSSLPGTGYWRDHWKQCVWFIPGEGLPVCINNEVNLRATHTDTSILYEVKTSFQELQCERNDLHMEDGQIFLLPERIALYGDSSWRSLMLRAINNTLQKKDSPLCCVADDSIFLTVAIASISKTSHVMSLFPGLRDKATKYLHAVSAANGFSMKRVEITTKRDLELKMSSTHQRKIDILVGEPFYSGGGSMLPWQNLRFWKERTLLDPILSEDVTIMPCKGVLRACAMFLPDLWRSRRCLNEVEGFEHSVVNRTLGACGDLPGGEESPCLSFPIWQCGEMKTLSDTMTVMEFDLLKPLSSCSGNAQLELSESGICHGIVLWIDWVMDKENSIVLSTGPDKRHWKQGVKLLEKPVVVEGGMPTTDGGGGSGGGGSSWVNIETVFDASSGDLAVTVKAPPRTHAPAPKAAGENRI